MQGARGGSLAFSAAMCYNGQNIRTEDNMDFTVDQTCDGRTLRDYLRRTLCVSSALLTALKAAGSITVDGAPVTVRHILRAGETVSLALADTECRPEPSGAPVDILFEDDFVLAAAKPPYMPTHESRGHLGDTLANALAGEFVRRGVPFVFRAVNRLDADTSGVLLVAKNRYAAERFGSLVAARQIEKTYIALLTGVPEPPAGVIDTYIRRTGESIILRASYPTGAPSERAVTAYETVETVGGVAVVRCRPKTGRTHQLRVHFAALGCPIVGDDLYGGGFALPRQALHAARLDFVHPITGAPVVIECPLAPDLAAYLETLRKEDRHA
ncbi:MAG: RluA family pseudouridine synthase [Clostridiales bacterium]|nr:RluA family pseudouridine synthase [Clostridiales bacterium]